MLQSNAILASLSAPHLKPVHLPQKTILHEAGDTIKSVYFPVNVVISLVITLESGETTEAAMIGRDGAVGIASALDGKIAMSLRACQNHDRFFLHHPAVDPFSKRDRATAATGV
jgi:CRP-like cAMP-binding protein